MADYLVVVVDSDYSAGVLRQLRTSSSWHMHPCEPNYDLKLKMDAELKSRKCKDPASIQIIIVKSHSENERSQDVRTRYAQLGNEVVDAAA